jgi:hypothetical protein
MSVTFHPNTTPAASHMTLRYWCDTPTTTATAERAGRDADLHNSSCGECSSYGGVLVDEVHEFTEVNLANSNAYRVLTLLGYDGDETYCGHATADDFLGRLLVADGLLETSDARDATIRQGEKGATLIDLGEPEGYLNEKLRLLIELANWAKANGSGISWS